MKNIICLSICGILSIVAVSAQEIPMGNYEMYISYKKGEYANTRTPTLIVGTPYLNENFQVGILSFEGKEPFTAPVRYNIVKEEIEVKLDGDTYYVNEDVEVKIEQHSYKKLFYNSEKDGTIQGYFKEISGKINKEPVVLLEKPIKHLKEAQPVAAMKNPRPAEYQDRTEFYLKFQKEGSAVEVENNSKKFIEVFPSHFQAELKTFMKDNKLKPNKVEDLLKIVNFYNSSF